MLLLLFLPEIRSGVLEQGSFSWFPGPNETSVFYGLNAQRAAGRFELARVAIGDATTRGRRPALAPINRRIFASTV